MIERGAKLFDRLVVAVLENQAKHPMFTKEERVEMVRESVRAFPNVEVDSFQGLLVDYAVRKNASLIMRGIRAISDYEYEWQMALMNRRLRPEIETVFMMAGEAYAFISSRVVKEVLSLGGSVSELVPPIVEARLKERLSAVR